MRPGAPPYPSGQTARQGRRLAGPRPDADLHEVSSPDTGNSLACGSLTGGRDATNGAPRTRAPGYDTRLGPPSSDAPSGALPRGQHPRECRVPAAEAVVAGHPAGDDPPDAERRGGGP